MDSAEQQEVKSVDCVCNWEVVKPCFTHDLGTQRCRLPISLFSLLSDICLGSYVLVDFGSHSTICAAYIWKDQLAKYCQVDETVTLSNENNVIDTSVRLSLSSFSKLHVETLKHVKVKLVVESYSDISNMDKKDFIPLLKDALSMYYVMKGCKIDCRFSAPSQLLKVCFVFVEDCNLQSSSAIGRVTPKTVVEITDMMSKGRYEAISHTKRAIVLGGLEKPKQLLHDLLMYPFRHRDLTGQLGISCPRGILLIGPPGTGKTSLVHAVAQDCGASLVYVAGPSICQPKPGDSESLLCNIFVSAQELSKEGPCVLFIDEVDSFLSKKGHEKLGSQQKRLLTQMLTLMDGLGSKGNLVLVGATNRPNVLDPAVRRPGRFDHEVYVGVPTQRERKQILNALTSKLPLRNVNLENIAECTPGFVGADLASLCQHVALSKLYNTNQQISITEMDFHSSLITMVPSMQRNGFAVTDYQHTSWNEIGGLENVKLQLKQSTEWPMKHPEIFQRLGVPKPKGVLLYGPPGCCKTTLVRAAATACNASFLSASAAQLYSPYVGDSEKAVVELFHRARLGAPTILFLDEIDSIVGKRNVGSHHGIHEKVLSTLLNEMDGIGITLDSKQGPGNDQLFKEKLKEENQAATKTNLEDSGEVLLIAATNRPDLLDEAILRPGRFDRIIYVPPPDTTTRLQILQVLTSKMPVSDVDFEDIAQRSHCFTGADLENLCKEAALYALSTEGLDARFISHQHFLAVLEKLKPSLSEQQINNYAKMQEKFSYRT